MRSKKDTLAVGRGGWTYFQRPAERLAVFLRFEDRDGRLEPVEIQIADDEPLTTAKLRAVPLGLIGAWANASHVAAMIRGRVNEHMRMPLRERDFILSTDRARRTRRIFPKPPYDDDFYRDIAKEYSALAGLTSHPAKSFADHYGLPVSTVHTWVRDARRRGFLPPGRAGKAG